MSVVVDTVSKPIKALQGVCGAPLRKKPGKTCQRTQVLLNGRCRTHGGKSLSGTAHPAFTTGRQSKYLYLPKLFTARIEALTYDSIGNLEDSVKTHIVLETRINEQFAEGCSLERWQEVRGVLGAYADHKRLYELSTDDKPIEPPDPDAYLARFTELVNQGLQDARNEELLAERLRTNHEAQRKLADTISKIRKESQETYTQEQWNAFMNVQLNILREVLEGKLMQSYLDKVRHFTDKNPKVLKA